jgi:hypothetical protein
MRIPRRFDPILLLAAMLALLVANGFRQAAYWKRRAGLAFSSAVC